MKASDWVVCPHCGEKIKRNAVVCRHCGSDDRTGWSELTYLDEVDLPGEDDYAEGLEREGFAPPARGKRGWLVAAVSLTLVLLFAAWLLRNLL
jgi:hypothetical protein